MYCLERSAGILPLYFMSEIDAMRYACNDILQTLNGYANTKLSELELCFIKNIIDYICKCKYKLAIELFNTNGNMFDTFSICKINIPKKNQKIQINSQLIDRIFMNMNSKYYNKPKIDQITLAKV